MDIESGGSMEQELISLANAIKELSVYRDSKEEALTEITHHIRRKNLRAYATSRGWIIIKKLDKRGNGNYYIETNEIYSIEGFMTPCELPLLEVAHSIHLIKQQFNDVFELSKINKKEPVKTDDLQNAKAGKTTIKKPKASYKKAILEAINILGESATNEQIYLKIKALRSGAKDTSYLYEIEFNEDEVENIDTKHQKTIVLISDGRRVSKQTFQDSVSELKR